MKKNAKAILIIFIIIAIILLPIISYATTGLVDPGKYKPNVDGVKNASEFASKVRVVVGGLQAIGIVVTVVILVIIALAIIKSNKKDLKLELNKLVEYLGGKDNILETEVEMSRFKVTLKDITKANKEGIIKLGAKGVVEIDDQLKIILGNNAKQLKKYIDEIKL